MQSFIYFPSKEIGYSKGRFFEEKDRVDYIIDRSGKNTFAFFNEAFSSTDELNAEGLIRDLSKQMKDKGAFSLIVTHFVNAEISEVNALCVGVEADSNRRTYKVLPANDAVSAFTADILKKYRLDKESLNEDV